MKNRHHSLLIRSKLTRIAVKMGKMRPEISTFSTNWMADLLWIHTHGFANSTAKITRQKTARIRVWTADPRYPRWAGRSGKFGGGPVNFGLTSENLRNGCCQTRGKGSSPTEKRILREIIPSLASWPAVSGIGTRTPTITELHPRPPLPARTRGVGVKFYF